MADFDDIKVGDEVMIFHSRFGRTTYIRSKVDKVHKLHFMAGGRKFRKHNGWEAGEFGESNAKRITPKLMERVREHEIEMSLKARRTDCRNFDWHDCPQDIIDKVHAIIKAKAVTP